ncbi:MAG: hypothetical protein H6956_05755 [Chromatiaceae bacterium]|nr:hypothetical protein [Chromatiaceae bacterium]
MENPILRAFAAIVVIFGLAMPSMVNSAVWNQQPGENSGGFLAGVWMQRYKVAVGQEYLEVLELHEDGTYTKHAKGWMADRGSYSVTGPTIAFRSAVSSRLNSDLKFKRLGKEKIGLELPPPLNIETEWTRVTRPPNFQTRKLDGRYVPGGLPALLRDLAQDALSWQTDALPTWIDIRELPNGHYATMVHFYSPSSDREMHINMTAYDVEHSTGDGARTATAALPPDILDLPDIVVLAKSAGVSGGLTRASVRMYKGYGAVWRVVTDQRQAASFSATTGERIRKDVTGYIAQSQKDWQNMADIWRKVLAQNQPHTSGTAGEKKSYWSSDTKSRCTANGGTWYDEGGIGKCR